MKKKIRMKMAWNIIQSRILILFGCLLLSTRKTTVRSLNWNVLEQDEERSIQQYERPIESSQQRMIEESSEISFKFKDLSRCNLSSFNISKLNSTYSLNPCIIYDDPPSVEGNRTFVITIVQVTPHNCQNHRDGSISGVIKMNEHNDGKGVAIGFNDDHYIKFRLISVVAGNDLFLEREEYDNRHKMVLSDMLETLKPQYIVGTCTAKASLEKKPALDFKTILVAQVGPPSFYKVESNDYVFGIHLNSDNYTDYFVKELELSTNSTERSASPIRVIYRNQSEFYYSTCDHAISRIKETGFTDVVEILYDPFADEDNDEIQNEEDQQFLHSLVDKACPPGSAQNSFHPIIFMCVDRETDIILERFRQNTCRPKFLWSTSATASWGENNQDVAAYFTGAGQWHENLEYKDPYSSSGKAILEENQNRFGYLGNYDMVVSYTVTVLFSEHIKANYRIEENLNVTQDFASESEYEALRKQLSILSFDTIFGPLDLDEDRRNRGRGAAASQWLPNDPLQHHSIRNKLLSPTSSADAKFVFPSKSAEPCPKGNLVSEQLIQIEKCLLCAKCELCPIKTYQSVPNNDLKCDTCPTDSQSQPDRLLCLQIKDNLIPTGFIIFWRTLTVVPFGFAAYFLFWVIKYRQDPVVKISQPEFLILIIVGAMISTSSIFLLTFQAGTGQDKQFATRACQAYPFLIIIGFTIQYGSLMAKSYRLFRLMNNPRLNRVKITAFFTSIIVGLLLLLNLGLLTVVSIVAPFEYEREGSSSISFSVNTTESTGFCDMTGNKELGITLMIIIGIIIGLTLIVTNCLLWKVRHVNSRYQESRYVALASLYICELLVIGIPIFIASKDNVSVYVAVFVGITTLNDTGLLCFIFVPKIKYQRKGLPEGVLVSESIQRDQFQKSVTREKFKTQLRAKGSGGHKLLGKPLSKPKLTNILEHSTEYNEDNGSGRHKVLGKPQSEHMLRNIPKHEDDGNTHKTEVKM